jgi:apolipoprotein D and lipocalin family protein
VRPGTGNAIWGMQFIWPIKAEYVVAWLDADYQHVIIGRSKRDYVWVMSRTPNVSDAQYRAFTEQVAALGYDTARLRRTPQRWPEP